jgi:hypothetical protein
MTRVKDTGNKPAARVQKKYEETVWLWQLAQFCSLPRIYTFLLQQRLFFSILMMAFGQISPVTMIIY